MDQVLSLHYAAVPAQPCEALQALWRPRLPTNKQAAVVALRQASDRDASVLGIALLARACAHAGVACEVATLRFPERAKPHGLVGCDFSISHAGGFVGCVLSSAAVGFDWEPEEAAAWSDLRQLLMPAECHRLQAAGWTATEAWVALEAIVKAAGIGMEQASEVRLEGLRGECLGRHFQLIPVRGVAGQVAWIATDRSVSTPLRSFRYTWHEDSAGLSATVA